METIQVAVVAIFMVLLAQSEAGAFPKFFKDCGSKFGKIASVSVSGCKDTDVECVLKKGTTVHVSVQFQSMEVINNSTAVVHGIVAGIPVPFPIPQADGCKSGLHCPVKNGAMSTYLSDIKVLKAFPGVRVIVKWELRDPATQDIFCALFKSIIQ